MKRGKPITRKTPLRAHKGLVRKGRLNRASELSRQAQARSERPTQTREERDARRLVAARSGGICERCGRRPATNWHHRQGRSVGGQWTAENGLHLCGSGTTGCHGEVGVNPAISFERGWMVRSGFNPAEVPVWLANRGWHYLTDDGGMVPADERNNVSEFKRYRRSAIAEMADWVPGFDMTGVSVSGEDAKAGSPKVGDKIARNPKNHNDRWLVAAAYAADNFEPIEDAA